MARQSAILLHSLPPPELLEELLLEDDELELLDEELLLDDELPKSRHAILPHMQTLLLL